MVCICALSLYDMRVFLLSRREEWTDVGCGSRCAGWVFSIFGDEGL